MKERRLYKRHAAGLPSRLEPVIPSSTEKIYHLETKDISEKGAKCGSLMENTRV